MLIAEEIRLPFIGRRSDQYKNLGVLEFVFFCLFNI
ncbi:hypothetical protein Patl1_18753 [Pistacia atlantica]|uniref:Uncharacterized protein n=1 Tax=Pistacia atlantica TaxID=434234 RepID=A0ACC1BYP6_9ROSI|nr:hypothetical protein Patl1_18753 [Pistacia atlantica]